MLAPPLKLLGGLAPTWPPSSYAYDDPYFWNSFFSGIQLMVPLTCNMHNDTFSTHTSKYLADYRGGDVMRFDKYT